MKKTTSHFDGVGLGIDLDRLRWRRDLRVFPVFTLVGILLLTGLLYLLVPRGKEEAPRPLSTKFIKRRPQMTRPLTMRKRPQPVVRPLKREKFVSEVPRAVVDRAGVSGMGGRLKVLESVIAHPKVTLERRVPFRKVQVGPTIEVGEIRIARYAKDHVDLALEMMDIESLDTGRYRGLVVIDPSDKRKVKGFLHLASVYPESIEEEWWDNRTGRWSNNRRYYNTRALQNLSRKMNEATQIRTDVVESLPLDSERLSEMPFILITANQAFTLTEAEAANLGRYLVSGGFAYVEQVGNTGYLYVVHDVPALREMVVQALATQGLLEGRDWHFEVLPFEHRLFHCYFDLESLPMGYWDFRARSFSNASEIDYRHSPDYLEGVVLGGRLVLVYSEKSYRDFWAGRAGDIMNHPGYRVPVYDDERPLQVGVNVLVYALTQEGGIAKRMVTGGR